MELMFEELFRMCWEAPMKPEDRRTQGGPYIGMRRCKLERVLTGNFFACRYPWPDESELVFVFCCFTLEFKGA